MVAWLALFILLASVAVILSVSGITQGSFLTTFLAAVGVIFLLLLIAMAMLAKRFQGRRK